MSDTTSLPSRYRRHGRWSAPARSFPARSWPAWLAAVIVTIPSSVAFGSFLALLPSAVGSVEAALLGLALGLTTWGFRNVLGKQTLLPAGAPEE